MDSTLERR